MDDHEAHGSGVDAREDGVRRRGDARLVEGGRAVREVPRQVRDRARFARAQQRDAGRGLVGARVRERHDASAVMRVCGFGRSEAVMSVCGFGKSEAVLGNALVRALVDFTE